MEWVYFTCRKDRNLGSGQRGMLWSECVLPNSYTEILMPSGIVLGRGASRGVPCPWGGLSPQEWDEYSHEKDPTVFFRPFGCKKIE